MDGGVRLSGRLCTPEGPALVAAVREATAGIEEPTIDLGAVEQLDGGVIALLRADCAHRKVRPRLVGGDQYTGLVNLYRCAVEAQPRPMQEPEGIVAHIGRATVHELTWIECILAFAGQMSVAAGRLLRRGRKGAWRDLPMLVQRAGADAIPIVVVINFLVGFVLAYMSARALRTYGADLFVADLVGIGVSRQLAPLMTAILVCGRSGAAYTTELGAMKVDEEIDALRTMGLEPFGWLAIPRLVSLVLTVPVLTLIGDVMGMLGGMVVAVGSLGLTPRGYLLELESALVPWDIFSGIVLSGAFALAIGLIACEQGFAASGGPQGVGRRTTSSVVTSLFAIVVLDACITVLFRVYGLS